MKQTFKTGDKVYCPMLGNKIYRLIKNPDKIYPLKITTPTRGTNLFSKDGKYFEEHGNSSLFHVTIENQELLSKLHNTEFEKAKSFLEYHLYLGSKVLCLVCEKGNNKLPNYIWELNRETERIEVISKKISDDRYQTYKGWFISSKDIYPIAINSKGAIKYLD